MIKANYNWKSKSGRDSIYGTITLKDDGKISISLVPLTIVSASEKYRAKKLAEEIVAANFIHESINGEVFRSNTILKDALYENTVQFKEDYLKRIEEFSHIRYEKAILHLEKPASYWIENYPSKRYPNLHNEDASRILDRAKTLRALGLEGVIALDLKNANAHYKQTVETLAYKLELKGVDSNFKIITGIIKNNFEITLECNGNLYECYTIIASGPIQQPHYRFLIKVKKMKK
jgi:hypothetical protein